jgi:hypothetical protein
MLRYQDENVELQKEDEITLKQFEDSNRIKEKDYKYDIRSLTKMKKEQEVIAQWKAEGILEHLFLREKRNGAVLIFKKHH